MNRIGPLYLIAICDILGWGIALSVLAPLMLTKGDFSHAFHSMSFRAIFLGVLFALYSLAQFVASPLISSAAAKYGRRQTLVVTTMGSCAGFFLSAVSIWVNSFSIMFLSRLIAGFFAGNQGLVQRSIFEMTEEKKKHKAHMHYSIITGLCFVIGPYLGGKLSARGLGFFFGYSTPFLFLAILFFICFALICSFYKQNEDLPFKKGHSIWNFAHYKEVFHIPQISVLFLLYFICVLGWFFYIIFLPAYFFDSYHFDQSAIGDHMGYLALSFAIGSFLINFLQKRNYLQKKVHVMIFLSIACVCVYLTSFHTPKGFLWLFVGLSGFSVACWWGLFLQYMKRKTETYIQVKVFDIASNLWALCLIIAPLLAGFILVHGSKYPIVLSAVFLFVGVVIQALFSISKSNQNPHA